MNAGDFVLGDIFDVKFTTITSTGAPITLAGTPAIAAYPGNSLTEITAGITLTVDFDARTGLHNVRVVASGANGYATATNYTLVLTAGTVDAVSVVGYVVASFSIENRVLNAAKIGADAITAAKIANGAIDAATFAAGAIDNAAFNVTETLTANPAAGGIVAASFGAGAIDAAAIATDAIGAAEFSQAAADKVWSSGTRTLTAFSTALALSIWDVLETAILTASSIGLKLKNNLDAAISTRATPAQVNAEVVDALNVDTYALPGQAAPPTTASIVGFVSHLYKSWRNKKDNDGATTKLYDDAGTTVDQKQATSEAAGTVTKDKWGSGP